MGRATDGARIVEIPEHLRMVDQALQKLTYGVIQLTVHNGKLMQLDVTERHRFT